MSFTGYKRKIEEGDQVIIHIGFDSMITDVIEWNKTIQTKRGAVKCRELIGRPYGCQAHCKLGYVHILHVTPELWTLTLPHRTQIVYTPDISTCLIQLEILPGSVVIESGTGSGSMSHAICRTIAPSGHLHTFEFHEERANKARREFSDHNLGDLVTVYHRDVCESGFNLKAIADAVFLDLPKPWLALQSAAEALKLSGGRICSFSPCIEQVQRTCCRLQELGFTHIDTVECLQRNYELRLSQNVMEIDTGEETEVTQGSEVEKAKVKAADGSQTKSNQNYRQMFCAVPTHTTTGHTAFLTFATWPPRP